MKKFLVSILIALSLVGLFASAGKAEAQDAPTGVCYYKEVDPAHPVRNPVTPPVTEEQCGLNVSLGYYWIKNGDTDPSPPITAYDKCIKEGGTPVSCAPYLGTGVKADQSAFQNAVDGYACVLWDWTVGGCLLHLLYYLFFQVAAFLLWLSALLFNILISITLTGTLLKSDFISNAWGIVRDLSNLFFILILLYIAITIILDMGGHGAKKMIAHVVIVALLINFSMFFTEIVVDTTNILALVFYNKIDTRVKTADGSATVTHYSYITNSGEKDVSGGMVSAFDPTRLLDDKFFIAAQKTLNENPISGAGQATGSNKVPVSLLIAMTITTGLVMLFAAYAFFISGWSFFGRLIELYVLIIFSPFAMMSLTIHKLASTEYIGWDDWFKRLIKTTFMAPIFMFFLYFIFLLVNANIFKDALKSSDSMIAMLVKVILPAGLILILLMKATEYAKKGGGKFGEWASLAGKAGVGLALGTATGGAALAARGTAGRAGAAIAESEWAKKREAQGKFGSAIFRTGAKAIGSGSFDLRGVKVGGKTLGSATGIDVGEAQKGGFTERRKAQVEARQKRAKELEVGEDEKLKQELNGKEADLQGVMNKVTEDFAEVDKEMEDLRKKKADTATGSTEEQGFATQIKALRDYKTAIKTGNHNAINPLTGTPMYSSAAELRSASGATIKDLETRLIPEAKHNIEKENRARKRAYADTTQKGWTQTKDFIFGGGQHSFAGSREAAHKIRMDAKIEDKSH